MLLLFGLVIFLIRGCFGLFSDSEDGPKATFSNCKLEENVIYKDKEMLKFSYDYNIKSAKDHKVQLVLTVESPKGTTHYKKDGNPLENKGDPFVVNSDDFSDQNKWKGLYYSSLNPKPGKNTYYAILRAFDLTTGEVIGKSDYFKFKLTGDSNSNSNSNSSSNKQSSADPKVTFSNCRLEENVVYKEKKMLKLTYDYDITGAKGREVQIVMSVECPKGKTHTKKDGSPLENRVDPFVVNSDSYSKKAYWQGFYNTALNPKPGKNTYYVCLRAYELSTGKLLGKTDYFSYTMTGNTDSEKKNTPPKKQASFSDCWLEPNVIHNNNRALKCHYTLKVNGYKNRSFKLVISIEYPQGIVLYESKTNLTSTYDNSVWNDAYVAIPNSRFMQSGENIYYVRYMLYDETQGTTVASSNYMSFTLVGASG